MIGRTDAKVQRMKTLKEKKKDDKLDDRKNERRAQILKEQEASKARKDTRRE